MVTVPHTPRSTTVVPSVPSVGPFAVGFRLFDSDGLAVYLNGDRITAFAVMATFADGYDDNASILLVEEIPAGTEVRIDGSMLPQRSASYIPTDPSVLQKINVEWGRAWATLIEQYRDNQRSLRIDQPTEPWTPTAGRMPLWDGTRFIDGPNAADIAGSQDAAARAEAAAATATEMAGSASGTPNFATRAAAAEAAVPVDAHQIIVEGEIYKRDGAGTALMTGDGATWTPADFSVDAFGPDGIDDTAAFQAAIDAVPDGTPIRLSNRNYVVTTASLNVGTKRIRWVGEGSINGGVASVLPGLVEIKHPTAQQQLHSLDQTAANGDPHLRVRRSASYTGSPAGSGSGFKAETLSGAGAGLYEFNAIFEHLTDSTAGDAQHCGSYNRIVKGADATANIWGFALAALNRSEVDAQTVGAEINIRVQDDHTVAGPLFNTGRRVILDLVGSTVDDLAATRRGRIDTGLQITCNTGARATNITYGIHLDSKGGGGGTIDTAIRVDTGGVGVSVFGGTGALVHGGDSPGGVAAVNLTGSGLSYGLSITGGYGAAIRVGNDLRMQFGDAAKHSIRYNSTGDALQFLHQSSAEIAMQIDDDNTNPFQIRVNATVRRVSVGAPDSAGAGYRQLRVVN